MNHYSVTLKYQTGDRVRFTLFVNRISLGELETTEATYLQMIRDLGVLNLTAESIPVGRS